MMLKAAKLAEGEEGTSGSLDNTYLNEIQGAVEWSWTTLGRWTWSTCEVGVGACYVGSVIIHTSMYSCPGLLCRIVPNHTPGHTLHHTLLHT